MVRRIFLNQDDGESRPREENPVTPSAEETRTYEDADSNNAKAHLEVEGLQPDSSSSVPEMTVDDTSQESGFSASRYRFEFEEPFEGPDHDERPIPGFVSTQAEITHAEESPTAQAEQEELSAVEAVPAEETVSEVTIDSETAMSRTAKPADKPEAGLTSVAEVLAKGREGKKMATDKQNDNLRFGFSEEQRAHLKVIGVGGAGSNAVDNMISSGLTGVEFIAINTDMQALDASKAPRKIQIGRDLTRGLGAGGDPLVGRASAEEDKDTLRSLLTGSEMLFLAAGMGGGTGSGAAPILAKMAREQGVLTVGIVTKPFGFEGKKRMVRALSSIAEMKEAVDTLIVIPNQKLLTVIEKNASFQQAFRKADDVLYQATKGISDIINTRGMVNVDFADAKAVMSNAGDAIMGIGTGSGENRTREAAEEAITSPLLDNLSIEGARGLLINITGNEELGMLEVNEAVELITERAGDQADVFFGIVYDANMGDKVSVTVIATGFTVEEDRRAASRVPEPSVTFRTQAAQGRPQTKLQSVRDSHSPANGNGHANGKNGHSNGQGESHNFLPIEATDDDLVVDSLPNDFHNIKGDDLEIPAWLRRRQQGR